MYVVRYLTLDSLNLILSHNVLGVDLRLLIVWENSLPLEYSQLKRTHLFIKVLGGLCGFGFGWNSSIHKISRWTLWVWVWLVHGPEPLDPTI